MTTIQVDSKDFYNTIARVRIAASKNASFPMLTCIQLRISGQEMTIIATDKYRLYSDSLDLIDPAETPAQIVLPAAAADDFKRLGLGKTTTPVTITTGTETVISTPTMEMKYPVPDGEYPSVDRLLAKAIAEANDSTEPGPVATFDPEMLAGFAKVRQVATQKNHARLDCWRLQKMLLVHLAGTKFWALQMSQTTTDSGYHDQKQELDEATQRIQALTQAPVPA